MHAVVIISVTQKRSRSLINRTFKKRIAATTINHAIGQSRRSRIYTQRCAHPKGKGLAHWIAMFFINCPAPPVVCRSKDKVKQGCNRPRGRYRLAGVRTARVREKEREKARSYFPACAKLVPRPFSNHPAVSLD